MQRGIAQFLTSSLKLHWDFIFFAKKSGKSSCINDETLLPLLPATISLSSEQAKPHPKPLPPAKTQMVKPQ